MSIANLYGKTPNTLAAINPALASKEYIPGGIMLSSPIFAPAAGFNASEVAGEDGRKVKLYYTKIGNQVTITCRMYIVDPAVANVVGDATIYIEGLNASGLFSAANLGPDIAAQITNDIQVKDNNVAGAIDPVDLRIPGLFVNATNGTTTFASIRVGEIRINSTAVAGSNLVLDSQYYSGSISFLATNSAIVV